MFENIIEFSAHSDYVSLEQDYPIPAKLNIPEWYKKLEHKMGNTTVKGCMPFLDSLTAGYILKIPQDFHVRHNVLNSDNNLDSFQSFALQIINQDVWKRSLNLNAGVDVHVISQLGESPLVEKNKNLPLYKIYNPWTIKTPKGYSCLFVPPLNNSDDRFSILPGIVDTDTFKVEINFPIVLNGDKYPSLETIIKKGTPYVQIIPFKRENWKMKIKNKTQQQIELDKISYGLNVFNVYKNKFWSKKSWK